MEVKKEREEEWPEKLNHKVCELFSSSSSNSKRRDLYLKGDQKGTKEEQVVTAVMLC